MTRLLFAAIVLMTTMLRISSGEEFRAGEIVIESPWTRATPRGATVSGGYLAIMNRGSTDDRLLGGTLDEAKVVQIHNMAIEGGVARMREVTNGIGLKPGATLKFEPGGSHLMFVGLARPLQAGEKLKGALRFERAGSVPIEFVVLSIGAKGP